MKLRLIELFAGIGAQAKALENLGIEFEHYRAVEFDKYAIKSYNAVHGTNFEAQDITETKGSDLGIVNTNEYTYLMTYSFPCQDLSVAGEQKGMEKGSNTCSSLLWEVERLLNEVEELPQILLMENVTQVHGKKNKAHFETWCEFLESKGYINHWQDLNAKNYGIPQNRNRCYMVSVLDGRDYEFPQPLNISTTFKDILLENVDDEYLLSEHFLEQIKNTKYRNTFKYKKTTDMLVTTTYPNECVMDYRYDEGLRIRKNNLLPTLTTRGRQAISGVPIIYNKECLRFITPLESWRAMGFDDADFYNAKKVNSIPQLYKQAGNSIVVNVLEEIFRNLLCN